MNINEYNEWVGRKLYKNFLSKSSQNQPETNIDACKISLNKYLKSFSGESDLNAIN